MGENAVAQQVVDAVFRVDTSPGPGLLESVYKAALAYEAEKRGLRIARQQAIPVVYQAVRIHAGSYADLVVEDQGSWKSRLRRTSRRHTRSNFSPI